MRQFVRLTIALILAISAMMPLGISISLEGGKAITIDGQDGLEGVTTISNAESMSASALIAIGEIQTAVDRADPGTTIFLRPKTYYDNVDVWKDLKIRGWSPRLTIVDGQQLGSVFTIESGVAATLSGMTIRNGRACPARVEGIVAADGVGTDGGGIDNHGTTTIENCIIKNNYADFEGGGAFNDGTLIVKNSQFISNDAAIGGGAIMNSDPGTLTVTNCNFIRNTAGLEVYLSSGGGAIGNRGGDMTISSSRFTDNIGSSAGAIFNHKGYYEPSTVTISYCTFLGNKAVGAPGEGVVVNEWLGRGGAIYDGVYPGKLIISHCIIAGNVATVDGGAIYWDATNGGTPGGIAPTLISNAIFSNDPNNIAHA